MSKRREPGYWVGEVGYHLVHFAIRNLGPIARRKPVNYPEHGHEAEPKWMLCHACGHSTWFIPIHWAVEDCTDWECEECAEVVIL